MLSSHWSLGETATIDQTIWVTIRFFFTCNASDHMIMASNLLKLNYPVHKKRTPAIICALQKWQSKFLGLLCWSTLITGHWKLDHKKDLSQHSSLAEFLAQLWPYHVYIPVNPIRCWCLVTLPNSILHCNCHYTIDPNRLCPGQSIKLGYDTILLVWSR